jgi:hypothetical protein
MRKIEDNINESLEKFKDEFDDILSQLMLGLREMIYWFDVEDVEERAKFAKSFSRMLNENEKPVETFYDLFHDKLKSVYANGSNVAARELKEKFNILSYVEDRDMERINFSVRRYKYFMNNVIKMFYDKIHDDTIDRIMLEEPVENILQLINFNIYEKTENILTEMINFFTKEMFNIARLSMYKKNDLYFYHIKKDKELEDRCDKTIEKEILELNEDKTPYPPFYSECTCSIEIADGAEHDYKKNKEEIPFKSFGNYNTNPQRGM